MEYYCLINIRHTYSNVFIFNNVKSVVLILSNVKNAVLIFNNAICNLSAKLRP